MFSGTSIVLYPANVPMDGMRYTWQYMSGMGLNVWRNVIGVSGSTYSLQVNSAVAGYKYRRSSTDDYGIKQESAAVALAAYNAEKIDPDDFTPETVRYMSPQDCAIFINSVTKDMTEESIVLTEGELFAIKRVIDMDKNAAK